MDTTANNPNPLLIHAEFNQFIRYCSLIILCTLGSLQTVMATRIHTPAHFSWSISGRILEKSGSPVPFATVNLLTADYKQVQAALADSAGRFSFSVFAKGNYVIRVSMIGYDSTVVKLSITDSTNITVPDIILRSVATELHGITITSKKPVVTQHADGITYDLQSDPDAKANSLFDMLRKVPYISIDGNNNILLKGSTGYRVFINGRPSGLVERNPQDVLKSIPASTIKSIEVITNPPAKYDAEGMAGIINIVTLKQTMGGYQGSVNTYWKGPGAGPGVGGSFALKEGKFGISVFTGGNLNNIPELTGSSLRTSNTHNTDTLQQHSLSKSDSRSGYVGLELSYEVDSLSLLTAQFNTNGNHRSDNRNMNTIERDDSNPGQSYDFLSDKTYSGNGMDAAINYQLGFKKDKNENLTLSYRYMQYGNDLNSMNTFDNAVNFTQPDYNQRNVERFREHTAQLDFTKPFGKVVMDIGSKAIFRNNNSNFENLLKSDDGTYVLDPLSSNSYNNNQNVFSFYNSYYYRTKKWEIKAGGRAEQTVINGDFSSGKSSVRQRYLNVVPTVVIGRNINSTTNLKLSYAIRIQRPAIPQLNPFVDRSVPGIVSSGNPSLRPVISSAWALSFLKRGKGVFGIDLGYLSFNKVINQTYTYDEAEDLVILQYLNSGKGKIYKANIYFNYPIAKWWTLALNSDLRYVNFEAINGHQTVQSDGALAYVNLANNFSLANNWKINTNISASTAGPSGIQTNINGYFFYSLGFSKSLLKDKLTISATATNLSSTYRNTEQKINGIGFSQRDLNQVYYRNFTVSLNYRFGKLNSEIKKNRKGINNDDLVK
ncbi:outer membrane beta-barrel protein [Chitinophaga sp.]|uniref:outer membrane beta-barrel protein n=1 Tax=Chitinophaga sp. TaxID=1869181 RepID=UPI002F9448C2